MKGAKFLDAIGKIAEAFPEIKLINYDRDIIQEIYDLNDTVRNDPAYRKHDIYVQDLVHEMKRYNEVMDEHHIDHTISSDTFDQLKELAKTGIVHNYGLPKQVRFNAIEFFYNKFSEQITDGDYSIAIAYGTQGTLYGMPIDITEKRVSSSEYASCTMSGMITVYHLRFNESCDHPGSTWHMYIIAITKSAEFVSNLQKLIPPIMTLYANYADNGYTKKNAKVLSEMVAAARYVASYTHISSRKYTVSTEAFIDAIKDIANNKVNVLIEGGYMSVLRDIDTIYTTALYTAAVSTGVVEPVESLQRDIASPGIHIIRSRIKAMEAIVSSTVFDKITFAQLDNIDNSIQDILRDNAYNISTAVAKYLEEEGN